MDTIEIGTAVSKEAGVAKGFLKVGDLPDGQPIRIPVTIVRGAQAGPTLWMHGCVHGAEYCGTYILHELTRSLDPQKLKGTVIALPALNITAFERSQRMSPFEGYNGGDMNRAFPGSPTGTLTQQMAHVVYTHLKKHASYVVDMHTAMTPDVRWQLFGNMPGDVGKKGEGMARAFGYRSTLPAPPDILAGSAMMTAAKEGIPGVIVEAGGKGPAFDDETVKDGAERMRNMMRHLGMLEGKVTDYGAQWHFSNFAWVHSTQGGLFQKSVKCGDRVEKGSVIGRYYDLHGHPKGEAHAPEAGIVLAIHPGPIMGTGETLIHIGLDPKEVHA
jgi:predicted deacylase